MLRQFRFFFLLLENSNFHIQQAREINTALIDFSRKECAIWCKHISCFSFPEWSSSEKATRS